MARIVSAFALSLLIAGAASAACVNKFVSRTEGASRQVVTLLTGKLTFQEAQALAAAIRANSAPPIEWVDEKGKVIARQFGDLKVVRPMPVGCDGKTSGVVFITTFPTAVQPTHMMRVRIDANTTVDFEQQ
jgi:hypothetical protein